ncbi:EscT/YscT/HrcT family type III secretion system export apparatus protein [Vibrio sp. CAIM 722]|uniref:EscT/YscT/HrcT family type III secretion system export apparatus protein n=1 Tax=Vibrio eleionomae TaxID=2653505 RepID=A0A7X4LQ94_9VIBR|nr:type III secretion system export apparatus subunit SctT [Vibrio eleionomae]MZI96034.1 EscT/YscT/HrcT family type III secretion system export apparatus protein [Vibrio eleionomae]
MPFQIIPHLTEWILAISLAMARLFPCLIFIPVFSFRELKGVLRYSIVVILALLVAPGIRAALPHDHSWFTLAGLYGKEVMLGILLGAVLSIPFWMFESVGALFDNQRGALMGGQLNPSLGTDFTPLGFLFKQSLIILMITTGSFLGLLQVIWDSYMLWPPTVWFPMPAADGYATYLHLLSTAFGDLVLYASPLVGLLLFIEFGLAILSLYSPQLQVFILSMPIKCLVGLMFIVMYMPNLFDFMTVRHLSWDSMYQNLSLFFRSIP